MDVELITEEDEDYVINENNAEYIDFAGVRCGICMDVVIDRGVLDCCQHWFCFSCIDNWASITNLCPLCQIEFQMITCVPVFDTIGSNETGEDLDSRDDDWRIEGQNNTASFPSYYIDENAVVCLEGDSCKIRSRSATCEADSVLDTSIACDACDVWYHAVCVGFDPEGTCENSWHCPRCLTCQKPENKEDDAPLSVDNNEDTRIPDTGVVEAELDAKASPKRVKEEALEENNQLVFLNDSSSVSDDDKFLTITENAEPTCESEQNDISFESSGIRNIVTNGVISESSEHINIVKNGCSSESSDITNIVKNGISSESSGIRNGVGSESTGIRNGVDSESSGIRNIVMNGASYESSDHMNIVETGVSSESSNLVENGICSESSGIKNIVMNGVSSESSDRMNIVNKDVSSEFSDRMNIDKNGVCSESSDIMNIVQDTAGRRRQLAARANATNASSEGGENVARLRVKKIMRRTGDDADSSLLVQKLRKEIREAVRNKSTEEIGESIFDPKLLAAFRAAIAGEETEFKKPPLDLKAKKALLQKGKVRENLTKKIYGFGGKRKRAWTRDCEVEFWKHRCSKVSRPEKLQTLNSVLKLLRNDTGSKELRRDNDGEILSRLYLADTSIFPRKDDIKPVAAQKDEVISEKKNQQNSSQNLARNPPKSEVLKRPVVGSTTEIKQPKKDASDLKTDSLKTDKRKWALEFLARRAGTNVMKEKEEDSAIPKDKYPLLAKLHKDMRPVLAPIHRNKVPISIRQAQLYRLTEHFLREANLPELAVADAVNIEKEVANRSSCKLVYLNMCSHQLSRRSDIVNSGMEQTTPSSSVQSDVPEGSHITSSDHEANEALRLAGLVDTPPSSPPQPEAAVLSGENEDDGPDNVIEMDAQPELDIYGDFEYNFDDDDIIGSYASAVKKTPEPMKEGPAMKVLFSTLNLSKSNGSEDISESHTETGNSVRESETHDEQPQTDIADEENGDPSLAECEELYGPDKEPLAVKYPETVAIKPPESVDGKPLEISETVKESSSSASHSNKADEAQRKKDGSAANSDKQADHTLVFKKVEAYVKEHIRPLCKSGVITIEQYRWSVGKTTEKVMKYHSKEKNANFLIKEGEKVKKLAERYVETAQQTV